MALVLRREVERAGLPLHAHRPQVFIEPCARDVILGFVRAVLQACLKAAVLRRLVLDRVLGALVEPSRAGVSDADVRKHVARRDEVAAGEAEDLLDLAVLLVDGVHVTQLHRAEAAGEAEERIAVRKYASYGAIELDRLLDLPDALQPGIAELSLSSKAEIRVLRVDREPAAGRRATAGASATTGAAKPGGWRRQRRHRRARFRRAGTRRADDLRVKLAVELDGADGVVAQHDLGLSRRRDEQRANGYGDCVPFHFSSSRKVFPYEEHRS